MVRLRWILAVFALPLAAQSPFFLGPERPVSEILYGPHHGSQGEIRAASNGSDFLFVWDGRGAARLSSQGELLDIPSLLLPRPNWAAGFDVVWNGSDYIVGWTQFSFTSTGAGIVLSAVRASGEIVPRLFEVVADIPQNSGLRLAWNGHVYAAAHRTARPAETSLLIFSSEGIVLRELKFSGELVEMTSVGGNFALLVKTQMYVFNENGEVLGGFTVSNDRLMDVTASPSEIVVLAAEELTGLPPQNPGVFHDDRVGIIRSSPEGRVLSTSSLGIVPQGLYSASIAISAGGFDVAWKSPSSQRPHPMVNYALDLWAARVDGGGSVVRKTLLQRPVDSVGRFLGAPYPETLASNGTLSMLSWNPSLRAAGTFAGSVVALPLDGSSSAEQAVTVSTQANSQGGPAVTKNGENILVAWAEGGRFPGTSIRASRVTDTGQMLDGLGILLADGSATSSPVAACDGQSSVVVWLEASGAKGTRVSSTGEPLDQPPFSIGTNTLEDITCAQDGMCLVSWMEFNPTKLLAARVQRGLVLDFNGVFLSDGGKIVTDGRSFLLLHSRPGSPGGTIYSATPIATSAGLTLGFSSDFAFSLVDHIVSVGRAMSSLWDGNHHVVFWSDRDDEGGAFRGTRLNSSGASVDGALTGWRGIEVARSGFSPVHEPFLFQGRILIPGEGKLMMISRETLAGEVFVSALPRGRFFNLTDGASMVVYARRVEDPIHFSADRLFFRLTTDPQRSRTVRRN